MKSVADQVLAERVLVTLKRVQFSPVAQALTELSILSGDVASRTAYGDQNAAETRKIVLKEIGAKWGKFGLRGR